MFLGSSGAPGYGWWVGGAFMVVCMAMMMLMMSRGSHGSHWLPFCGMNGHHEYGHRRPEETLAERLATGAIDTEEYERRLAALRETNDVGKPV